MLLSAPDERVICLHPETGGTVGLIVGPFIIALLPRSLSIHVSTLVRLQLLVDCPSLLSFYLSFILSRPVAPFHPRARHQHCVSTLFTPSLTAVGDCGEFGLLVAFLLAQRLSRPLPVRWPVCSSVFLVLDERCLPAWDCFGLVRLPPRRGPS